MLKVFSLLLHYSDGLEKNILPHDTIYSRVKVKLMDSGCLNRGNLWWKDLKNFNKHLQCAYSIQNVLIQIFSLFMSLLGYLFSEANTKILQEQ